MKAKRTKLILICIIAALLAGSAAYYMLVREHATSGKTSSAAAKQLYTCGMHPQVVQDHPGDCPICGMRLVPLRRDSAQSDPPESKADPPERKIKYYKSTMMLGEISQTPRKDSMGMDMVPVYADEETDSGSIKVDPVTIQTMGIRTAVVSRGPLRRNIRTVGVIDFDETAVTEVTTKFKGWIEKLYVDATGKQVKKGEPLFDIYSPDLYTAQQEYALALKQAGNPSFRESSLTKLKYFDVPEEQIAELAKTGRVRKALRVNVPRDGVVVEKNVVEGQMVDVGAKLFRLADLSLVWVQSQVYEQDLAYLRLGQEAVVNISYLSDRKFRGRITYVYPTVDDKTRTGRVRMEFHNPGLFLKPGMFVTAEIQAELSPSTLLIPDMAVLRSGEKNTVFVALDGGKFSPRTVVLGPRSENNEYQVLSGLSEGERVVTSGQFMLDSESQLREAIQKMLEPATSAASEKQEAAANPEKPAPAANEMVSATEPQPSAYVCPMPEHSTIEYQHPGKCPLCGMTLIPKPSAASPSEPQQKAQAPQQ